MGNIAIDKWGKVVIEEDLITVSGFEVSWVGDIEPTEEHPVMEFFPEMVLRQTIEKIDALL